MNYYLSLSASKQLKEWGCNIPFYHLCEEDDRVRPLASSDMLDGELHPNVLQWGIPTYDIRNIICNGEMAKAFFGEDLIDTDSYLINEVCDIVEDADITLIEDPAYIFHTECLKNLLQQGKKEAAEKYLLENCLWNPRNKS